MNAGVREILIRLATGLGFLPYLQQKCCYVFEYIGLLHQPATLNCGGAMVIWNAVSSTAHPRRPAASTHNAYRAIITILLMFTSVHLSAADVVHRPLKLSKVLQSPLVDLHQDEYHRSSKVGNHPQRFFEVSKPITTGHRPVEAIQLLYHEFADTSGIPPPSAQYNPTKKVLGSKKWDKVVIKWSAVCRGRQFDRIAAVWLGGVEIFRTCTAEPTTRGIIWEVEKDVTRFASLWKEPQEVVVSLGNVVDSTYTGIINVTLSVNFYHGEHGSAELQQLDEAVHNSESSKLDKYSGKPADVILPINEASYLDGGYWFQLSSEADKKNTSLQIPQNTYRAVLEVCVSPHGNDEFWYTNPPNAFLEANNLTDDVPGNGSFREVVVLIDDRVVGAVWPFIVVYTGGVNPLFWRPAAAIGAFDLPSYDVDITPFVGYLLDGKNHTFSLTVKDALYLWLLQANLHIWVDPQRNHTSGSLVEYSVPSSSPTVESNFRGLDGTFITRASRTLSYVGYVASSFGNLTTSFSSTLKFSNTLRYVNNLTLNTVDQVTATESTVAVRTAKKEVSFDRIVSSYPFYLYYLQVTNPDTSVLVTTTITHSLNKDIQSLKKKSSSFSSLSNIQKSTGELFISVNNTISGLGATQQTLSYLSTEGCYQRTLSTKNYTVLSDTSSTLCSHPS